MIRVIFILTGKAGGRLTGVDTLRCLLLQIALLILRIVALKAQTGLVSDAKFRKMRAISF